MNDTHDERGGDETPLARVQAFQRAANPNGDYHWPAEEAANVNGVPLYFDDIESLAAADNFDAVDAVVARWRKAEEQLAAVTARTEKAEARLAELGEPEVEQRIVGVSGRVYTPTEFDLPHRADWVPGVRLEERQVYPTPWRVAPDAAQDGLSATETDADGSQGSGVELEFGKGAAGLSACCRATKVEGGVRHHCDSDAPHDTHECGDCAHRWDDTTEDGQHG